MSPKLFARSQMRSRHSRPSSTVSGRRCGSRAANTAAHADGVRLDRQISERSRRAGRRRSEGGLSRRPDTASLPLMTPPACRLLSARRLSSLWSRTPPAFSSMPTKRATVRSSDSMPANFVLRAWCPRRLTRPNAPGDRGLWRKSKCLNRRRQPMQNAVRGQFTRSLCTESTKFAPRYVANPSTIYRDFDPISARVSLSYNAGILARVDMTICFPVFRSRMLT